MSSPTEGKSNPESAGQEGADDFFNLDQMDADLNRCTQEWIREQAGLNPDGSFPVEGTAEQPSKTSEDASSDTQLPDHPTSHSSS